MILAIIVIILLMCVRATFIYKPRFPTTDIKTAKTGDLVFMKNCTYCKCSSVGRAIWELTAKTLFNSARWYITGEHHTHVAVVVHMNGEPHLAHIDGGDPLPDVITGTMSNGVSISPLSHLDTRGGPAVLYRCKKNIDTWAKTTATYPNFLNLILVNVFKLKKNKPDVMACTDFVEWFLHDAGLAGVPSRCATLTDIRNIAQSDLYGEPHLIKNKCFVRGHYPRICNA